MQKEALFYTKLEDSKVKCELCPVGCIIAPGKKGVCIGRKNVDGKLMAINYGQVVSVSMDPIEKKPLYHFYPGSDILSIGPNSCNLRCKNCQNWAISQQEMHTDFFSPEDMVDVASKNNSIGIAYTYTEPLVWYEYVLDTGNLVREKGMVNVLVTNGYINPGPLEKLLPLIDAMNIDLKSIEDDFYREVCKGKVSSVLKTIETVFNGGCHLEITNLVIPGLNDSEEQMIKLVDWVAKLSDKIPLHFSRYFPDYQMKAPPTPITTLSKAYKIGREKLKYVYVGNAFIYGASDTYCPSCGNTLIRRERYNTGTMGIADKRCKKCGSAVDIIT